MKHMEIKQKKDKKQNIIGRMKTGHKAKTRDLIPFSINEYTAQQEYIKRLQ